MTWMVQLTGDTSDLSALAQSLMGTDINISLDGQDYILTSDRFAPADDAAVVRQKAEEMVTLLNGGSRLALDTTESEITQPPQVSAWTKDFAELVVKIKTGGTHPSSGRAQRPPAGSRGAQTTPSVKGPIARGVFDMTNCPRPTLVSVNARALQSVASGRRGLSLHEE